MKLARLAAPATLTLALLAAPLAAEAKTSRIGPAVLARADRGDRVMDRRAFITGMAGGLIAAPLVAEAQQSKRVYTIAVLTQGTCPTPPTEDPLRLRLRDLGYSEGQNIVIECRGAAGQPDRLRDLAADLVRLKVDVLVTQGTLPALAAKQRHPRFL